MLDQQELASRTEILNWINNITNDSNAKIEHLGNGYHFKKLIIG